MNTKLYVENLPAATSEEELKNLFSAHGNVSEVNVPVDRQTGSQRGFGFVTMATPEGARAAIQALNGRVMNTGTLVVSEAKPREQRYAPPSSSHSGGEQQGAAHGKNR